MSSPTLDPSTVPTCYPTNVYISNEEKDIAIMIIVAFSLFACLFLWCFSGGPTEKCDCNEDIDFISSEEKV